MTRQTKPTPPLTLTERMRRIRKKDSKPELTVRRLRRRTSGEKDVGVGVLDLRRLHAALGPRALVEIVEQEGRLHAVVAAAGR